MTAADGKLAAYGGGKIWFLKSGTQWEPHAMDTNINNIVYIPGTGYIGSSYVFKDSISTIFHSTDGMSWTARVDRDPGVVQDAEVWAVGEVSI
jgi:hypothetical protein